MGVTVLQVYPDPERLGSKHVEKLHMRIAHLGATPAGQFVTDCETNVLNGAPQQTGAGQQQRKLHILHNSEMPTSTFSIIESPTKGLICLSADLLLDLLMPRLSHVYTSKKNLKIESKGTRFTIGDFVVKIGTVTMASGQYRGILVEVEYLACCVPSLCWPFVREFMQSFMGSHGPSAPAGCLQTVFHQQYKPLHTMQQYLEKFNEFRDANHAFAAPTTSTS